jgi:acid phosphatase type 7
LAWGLPLAVSAGNDHKQGVVVRGAWIGVVALLVGLGAGLVGCDRNLPGRLAATETGTLLDPPAPRGSPLEAFDAACGTVDGGPHAFRRAPYLQEVGAHGATVVWTMESPEPAHVELTLPDGSLAATGLSTIELTRRLRGASQHYVRFEGLEPATLYCYSIVGDGAELLGRSGFRTAPAPGSGQPVRFLAFGDSGTGSDDQRALRNQMFSVPFDLAIHVGDVAYERGNLGQLEHYHFAVYDPLFRSLPHYPVAGNHDYRTDDAAPFREVFHLPRNAGEGWEERWFSFDWGDVHFVGLDSECVGATQAEWLRADLLANALPWVVVYAHKPPYSSGHHGGSSRFRRWFSPILDEHGVQLVVAGHDHHYERTRPMGGVHHFVSGGGGKGVRIPGKASFTEHAQAVIHFLYVEVQGDEMRVHAIDGTGREFDGAVIARTVPSMPAALRHGSPGADAAPGGDAAAPMRAILEE